MWIGRFIGRRGDQVLQPEFNVVSVVVNDRVDKEVLIHAPVADVLGEKFRSSPYPCRYTYSEMPKFRQAFAIGDP